jgi:hypothetical protein
LAVIWGGIRECYGFCPSRVTLSTAISLVFVAKLRGEVVVNSWWNDWCRVVAYEPMWTYTK